MRQISTKQAEKWLQKLRNDNPNGFRQMNKILKKYEKLDDQYDCYVKTSHVLLQSPNLARDINGYLQQGNKFVINESEQEKITKLIGYVREYRIDKFRQILTMIEGISNKSNIGQMNPDQQNSNIIAGLKSIVKGDAELEQITQRALLSGEQLINSLNLTHLKINHQPQIVQQPEEAQEEDNSQINSKKIAIKKPQTTKQKQITQPPIQEKSREAPKIPKTLPSYAPITINEQNKILRSLQKSLDNQKYDYIIKVIHIYSLCIITRNQCISLIDFIKNEEQLEYLKDIIQSRQNDRRRLGAFRPLNDNDYSITQRASPSYVTVPTFYPIRCSNRTPQLRQVLNEKWVSVPHGSQQYFNVRNKNVFQTSLLKSEDERYQFDLYTNRLKKAIKLLDNIIEASSNQEQENYCIRTINTIIEMGVIQIVYKNANRQQKQQLQWHLKSNQFETCKLFRQRIIFQLNELKNIKEIHANKNWIDVANKNWLKSLDLKSFQFKKGQKQKMKGTSFITELNDKIKILEPINQIKLFASPFQEKKLYPTILNSFQSSSKVQKCFNRKLPSIKQYTIEDFKDKTLLPVMVFAFQDKDICNKIYSLILFFIDTSLSNQIDRIKSKTFLQRFLVKYLGWNYPQRKCLSSEFDEDKFHNKIVGSLQQSSKIDLDQWIYTEKQNKYIPDEKDDKNLYKYNILENEHSLAYEPQKEKDCKILYTNENLYVFVRFLYALYQRYIKLEQIAQSGQKVLLFDILFFSCIRTKETVKFQQNLNLLFGRQSYLFSTIYKLFENLLKSLLLVATCMMTTQSFKYSKNIGSQDIYYIMFNKYCLQNRLHDQRIIRFNYFPNTTALYMNSLYSYYKVEQTFRDQSKKLIEISKNIEYYMTQGVETEDSKKRKLTKVYQENQIQYFFDSNNYKLTSIAEKEDLIFQTGNKPCLNKTLKKQFKRIIKLNAKLND